MSWGHNQPGPGPGPGPGFNPMGQNQPVHPGTVMANPQGAAGPPGGPMVQQQAHPAAMGGQGHPGAGGPGASGPGPQMGHPVNPQNHQMAQNPNQMGQSGQMGQIGTPQDIDDPIYQLKKMVPKLKESLHSVMTISSTVLARNTQVDYTGDGERRTVQSSDVHRQELEKSFEQFYHVADLLEAQIKLAQQQCMNTLQACSTVAAQFIHFNKVDQQTRMPTNFDLSKYNDYIEIVRDQIKCAQEASHILQRSYQDLQNIDIPGRRNPNTNNQNNTRSNAPSSPAASTPTPGPASVGSPAAAQPPTPAAVSSS